MDRRGISRAAIAVVRAVTVLSVAASAAEIVRDVYEGQALKLHEARDRSERDYILHALATQQGNISCTAEILEVERSNLYSKMRACGIGPVRKMEGEGRSA